MAHGCLYRLLFPASGKAYIGISSRGLGRRLALHRHQAKEGRPTALSAAIRKYGEPIAELLIISDDWAFLCEMERRAIIAFGTRAPAGYNLTDGGEGVVGKILSDETKARLRAIGLGRPSPNKGRTYKHTPEAIEKIRAAGLGREFSPARRAKIGATKVGNTYGAGHACSEEKKRKISEAQKGKSCPARGRRANAVA